MTTTTAKISGLPSPTYLTGGEYMEIVQGITNYKLQLYSVASAAYNLKSFGAKGDGSTDDTAALLAAVAAVSATGGALFVPAGTYLIKLGNGATPGLTIAHDNVTIFGEGAQSLFTTLSGAGTTPNNNNGENQYNATSQWYPLFYATGRSNIRISGLRFAGYLTPCYFDACTNVIVEECIDNGLLANAGPGTLHSLTQGPYLRSYSFYFNKCKYSKVERCHCDNVAFGVYIAGTGGGTNGCQHFTVSNCSFTISATATNYSTQNPVGVYVFYGSHVTVQGCHFEDIYPSVNQDPGNYEVWGYGIYEGDGVGNQLAVIGNTFKFYGKGSSSYKAVPIRMGNSSSTIQGNQIEVGPSGYVTYGVWIFASVDQQQSMVAGNVVTFTGSQIGGFAQTGLYLLMSATQHYPSAVFSDNAVYGGDYGIRADGTAADTGTSGYTECTSLTIDGNDLRYQWINGIYLSGNRFTAPYEPLIAPRIMNNSIIYSQKNAIYLANYVTNAFICGNSLIDGNMSNTAGDAGSAIYFYNYSDGSTIVGNVIGNTPLAQYEARGGGHFTYGVQNAQAVTSRAFKDIIANNNFFGLTSGSLGNYYSSSPQAMRDAGVGDIIVDKTAATRGWRCTYVSQQPSTAAFNAGSTRISVASTAGMAPGGGETLVAMIHKASATTYDPYEWGNTAPIYARDGQRLIYCDTVTVLNGTTLTLASGAAPGDVGYMGYGSVTVVRFAAA
jgi:hypothetical protein